MALIAQDGVDLTPTESTELSHRAFAHRGNRADSKRALAILLLAGGDSYTEIQKAIGCSSQFVARWKARFMAERLAGLDPVEPGGRRGKSRDTHVTPQQEARVLAMSRETPPDGATHWTPDSLARALRLDPKRVTQIWQAAGIDPKRVECFRDATGTAFEEKSADLIGLCVQGSQRIAVFALDEASAAAAAARNGSGHANGNGNGHSYAAGLNANGNGKANGKGNGHAANGNEHGNGHGVGNGRRQGLAAGDISSSGSLSLYAMLNSPQALRKNAAASPSLPANSMKGGKANVGGFIDDVLKKGTAKRAVHVFVEGLDEKRAAALRADYRRRGGVQLHFADSYATWLNQVDIWLAKIDRDFVAGKVLTRHAELRHKVMQSLRATEKRAQGLRWKLGDQANG